MSCIYFVLFKAFWLTFRFGIHPLVVVTTSKGRYLLIKSINVKVKFIAMADTSRSLKVMLTSSRLVGICSLLNLPYRAMTTKLLQKANTPMVLMVKVRSLQVPTSKMYWSMLLTVLLLLAGFIHKSLLQSKLKQFNPKVIYT